MLNKIKKYYLKYKEIINYLICGGLSTIVNIIAYCIFSKLINLDEVLSSALSWFVAVLFAYVVNKFFVFESKAENKKEFLKELISFIAYRIISGTICDVGAFALMVKIIKINDFISKIVTQVMVVILNYIFSKFFIFKKNKEQ